MFKPEMEIVLFAAQDIVTTSGDGSGTVETPEEEA